MHRSTSLIGLVLAALLGCNATVETSTGSDVAEVATSETVLACSAFVGAEDGRYAFYEGCSTGGDRSVMAIDLTTGTSGRLASVRATDQMGAIGTAGRFVYWLVQHAGGGTDLQITAPSAFFPNPPAVRTIPLAATGRVASVRDLVVTKSGLIAFLTAEVGTSAARVNRIVVFREGSATPLVSEPLVESDAYRLLFDARTESGAITDGRGLVRRFDLRYGTDALGPVVQPDRPLLRVEPGSFHGDRIIAFVRDGEDYAVASVGTWTGRTRILAPGLGAATSIIVKDEHVWYSAHQPAQGRFVLARVTPLGPQVLATDPDRLDAVLTFDGSALFFRGGSLISRSGPSYVGVVAADGATPASIVIPKEDDVWVEPWSPWAPRRATKRFLVRSADRVTGRRTTQRLVDARSGSVLGTWVDDAGVEGRENTVLSGDGEILYQARPCNTTGVGPSGQTITQLWPSAGAITGCMAVGDGHPTTLANSSVALLSRSFGSQRFVTILRP